MGDSVSFLPASNRACQPNDLIGGPEGLRSLTNPKAIVVDRWWIQTSIPKVLDYPLRSLSTSWWVSKCLLTLRMFTHSKRREFSSNLVRFLYGYGWRSRIGGLIKVAQTANK